jgi:pheromone shutdown-related protein TraB
MSEQPIRRVQRDGVEYVLLGTAHVSKASVDAVHAAIATGEYDAVAVELDPQRMAALLDPDALARLDLVKVLREGKAALFAANLGLAAYQRRLAEQLGIEPGAELKAAVQDARDRELPLELIDRDIGLTFKRASTRLGWWGRAKLAGGLVVALVADEEVRHDEIEKLKQGDLLEASFGEFAEGSPELYEAVIAERDRYMAARLRESAAPASKVLAVVGAGHLQGLARHLREDSGDPAMVRAALETVSSKRRMPWFTIVITALLVGGVAWGVAHGGLAVGANLIAQWVAITAGCAALGALCAGGHPLSILAGAAVAPFKPFRPAIPAGAVSGLVEAQLRKPTYADFLALRDDVRTLRGWYRNRVARTLLVFLLTNIGTMIGEWIGILRIAGKLAG